MASTGGPKCAPSIKSDIFPVPDAPHNAVDEVLD